MQIVWDEPKRLANLAKHGMDFADVAYFDWENALIGASHSDRLKAIGHFGDGAAVVIFALLGSEAISIVSFRPASIREKEALR